MTTETTSGKKNQITGINERYYYTKLSTESLSRYTNTVSLSTFLDDYYHRSSDSIDCCYNTMTNSTKNRLNTPCDSIKLRPRNIAPVKR